MFLKKKIVKRHGKREGLFAKMKGVIVWLPMAAVLL
jgi:hypothetical protein